MITKNGITYLLGTIFLVLLVVSCHEKEVIITKDYVINPNWVETDHGISVTKLKLKDRSDIINLKNVSPSELLQKLVEDTTFDYSANVNYNGTEFSKRKVFFNRDNGFTWWGGLHKPNPYKKILGELQPNTWYLLGGLSSAKTLYYVYIDSNDSLHSFRVPASYWTNY